MTTIPSQNHKYWSWHHFRYSQVNRWSLITCQRSLMTGVTRYRHSGSQQGRIPTQVQAGRPHTERNVGGTDPSRMKVWSSPGRFTCRICMCIGNTKPQILGEYSVLYLRARWKAVPKGLSQALWWLCVCVCTPMPVMRWQVSYFGASLPKSWVSLFPCWIRASSVHFHLSWRSAETRQLLVFGI